MIGHKGIYFLKGRRFYFLRHLIAVYTNLTSIDDSNLRGLMFLYVIRIT